MTVNLKNVDLNLLVIFEAVYSTGNISRAADRLSMSQPAVSNALARLRELIDDPLFVRAARGVEPTSKTREMINPVREALGLIGRHLDKGVEIDLSTYKRIFRVIIVDALEPIIMPPLVRTTLSGPDLERAGEAAKVLSVAVDAALDQEYEVVDVKSWHLPPGRPVITAVRSYLRR